MNARNRGFTLIELLVASAIALLAIGAVTSTFISQNRSFVGLDLQRQAAEAGRDALLDMESALRRAGYGIDPRYAFDFSYYACPAANCRDSTTGPDNIVFYSRNPDYTLQPATCSTASCLIGNGFPVASASATQISVTLPTGVKLHKGRVVELVCAGASAQTMATVSSEITGTGGSANVQIMGTATPANPYRENNFTACYSAGGAAMFLVDRYHYLIQTYNGVPWLVLDTGLDLNSNGTLPENGADLNDYLPIAPGVEGLQLAYVLNINAPVSSGGASPAPGAGPDSDGNWVIGDAYTGSGTSITGVFEQPDTTIANMPTYQTVANSALRFNKTAANIRAVRINLAVRSLTADMTQPSSWTGDTEMRVENRTSSSLLSGGNYRRYAYRSTVACRDMESRSPFFF